MPEVEVKPVQIFEFPPGENKARKVGTEYEVAIAGLDELTFKSKRNAERLAAALQRLLNREV